MAWMALLPAAWGPLLSAGLRLDPLAAAAVNQSGVAAGAVQLAASLLVLARLRRGVRPAAASACARDLAYCVAACSFARWGADAYDPRVPYIEAFSVMASTLAVGWGACLGMFLTIHPLGRGAVADEDDRPPGLRGLYVGGAGALGLLASGLLGVALSARAAGDVDRARIAELGAVADLVAVAVPRLGPDQALGLVTGELYIDGIVLAPGATPGVLSGPDARAADGDGWLLLFGEARWHVVTRTVETPEGEARTLWMWQTAGIGAPVRAPDDAPAILILGILMLGAPLGAWLIGHDAVATLSPVSEALGDMGGEGRPAEVPEASNDEIGDLAGAVNATIRRFEDRNQSLADELGAAAGSDQTRTGFLHAASYELRTPLTTIAGYCHLLRQTPLNEAQQEDVRVIADATRQLQAHVDEILNLSRIESGAEAPLERMPVDLELLARDVLAAELAGDAPGDGAVVTQVSVPAPVPTVDGDAQRLRQVVANLVGNALKFTDSGYVEIRLAEARLDDQPAVLLQVVDTGPGIPEADLERIFDEFHRVADHRAVAGTGLGLTIARRLVTRHGGRLRATSIEGEGTTMHLLLPVSAQGEQA